MIAVAHQRHFVDDLGPPSKQIILTINNAIKTRAATAFAPSAPTLIHMQTTWFHESGWTANHRPSWRPLFWKKPDWAYLDVLEPAFTRGSNSAFSGTGSTIMVSNIILQCDSPNFGADSAVSHLCLLRAVVYLRLCPGAAHYSTCIAP